MDTDKLLMAADSFRTAAIALEEVAQALKEHEAVIFDLCIQTDKNNNLCKKMYELLRESEEFY